MLHVIADFDSELTAFIFAGLQRDDVRLLHHPAQVRGIGRKLTRALECGLPGRRLDWHYPRELIRQLDAIKPGDAVLVFAMGNPKNLLLLQKYLRQARVHAFMWNPVFEHGADRAKAARRLTAVRRLASDIATFDPQDAQAHGFKWVPQPYRRIELPAQPEVTADFCFIGMDKGRLPFLQQFKLVAERAGLRCGLHVLPDKGRSYCAQERELLATQYLSYADNLAHAARARCLLEVVQTTQSGGTLRSVEALFLHRKLITTRQSARQEPGFDPRRVLVIDDPDRLDAQQIRAFMAQPAGEPDLASMQAHEINHWLDYFA